MRDADADREIIRPAAQRIAGAELFLQPTRQQLCAFVVTNRRKNNKFITTQTRQDVRTAERFFQYLGGPGQRAIAFVVSVRVIDLFQTIEIRIDYDRNLVVSFNRGDVLFSYCEEAAAIIETR